jgi:hypothetical protein
VEPGSGPEKTPHNNSEASGTAVAAAAPRFSLSCCQQHNKRNLLLLLPLSPCLLLGLVTAGSLLLLCTAATAGFLCMLGAVITFYSCSQWYAAC